MSIFALEVAEFPQLLPRMAIYKLLTGCNLKRLYLGHSLTVFDWTGLILKLWGFLHISIEFPFVFVL